MTYWSAPLNLDPATTRVPVASAAQYGDYAPRALNDSE